VIPKPTPELTKIEQKHRFRGKQRLTIRPDGELEVDFQRIGLHRVFTIPLWQINPRPEQIAVRSGGSLVGSIIFAVFSLVTIIGMFINHEFSMIVVLLFPLFLFVGLFLICLWRYQTQSVNSTVFYLGDGGQIHVWNDNPDSNTVAEFCKTLVNKADQSVNLRKNENGLTLAGEILELQKLVQSGVLSGEEFQRAKDRLLGGEDARRIGFGM
jgi:hypothetical protein